MRNNLLCRWCGVRLAFGHDRRYKCSSCESRGAKAPLSLSEEELR